MCCPGWRLCRGGGAGGGGTGTGVEGSEAMLQSWRELLGREVDALKVANRICVHAPILVNFLLPEGLCTAPC